MKGQRRMNPEYIIIQAGGKGSRMESLTRNKPKALVPVNNLPMIFHLFHKYPQKKFIVIGDYKYDVLEKYLNAFSDVDYRMICATGKIGTCAGMQEALALVPEDTNFLIIWCDLVLPQEHIFPSDDNFDYIGISKDFPCRWSYVNGEFIEEKSEEYGVAGYYLFRDKSTLINVPQEGEFVRWMRDEGLKFREHPLYKTHEYGLYSEWDKLPKMKCRPFNSIKITNGKLIKQAIDKQGQELAKREVAWYKKYLELVGTNDNALIPRISEFEPLTMEEIKGKNIYEYGDIPNEEKKEILKRVIDDLKVLHSLDHVPSDKDSYYEAYIGKTKKRLEKIRRLVPFADKETICINGKRCRNIFYYWDEIEKEVMSYFPNEFVFIHGDCTFSNILLRNDNMPIFIDPRGYFGNTELYGDSNYDWAKLYYSLFSNYDQFNLKRFRLYIRESDVTIEVDSNQWESLEDVFFELLKNEVSRKQMKMMLAIIWLSLTTYAWEDYDSICGAFYIGLIYFEDALKMSKQGTGDKYFGNTMRILCDSIENMDMNSFEMLIKKSEKTLNEGHKIIASGLGKNVPVCEKFVGTMLSLGLDANFMHTNTAVHGDLGMVKSGDLVIVLTKSGNTSESVYLIEMLKKRDVEIILITFNENSKCEKLIGRGNCIVIPLEHEGDMWNIVPNNSTTLNLIVLQGLALSLADRLNLQLMKDFKPNHPAGSIGEVLK